MAQIPTPPPIPPAGPSPAQRTSDNRTLMLVLAYLGPLALVPLLTEKEDPEIQWHAKHGLVLTIAWVVLLIALWIVALILSLIPVIGWVISTVLGCGSVLVPLAILVVHIIAIMKALKGERLVIPVLTEYANKWV